MTRDEFIRLAESWGGDLSRWPIPAQDLARDYAATEDGKQILQEVRNFDRLLSGAPNVDPRRAEAASRAVMRRIAAGETGAAATRLARLRMVSWPRAQVVSRLVSQPLLQHWTVPAAGIACSLLIGLSLGAFVPPTRVSDGPQTPLDLILDTGFTPLWGSE
jgi:hypothetical protein